MKRKAIILTTLLFLIVVYSPCFAKTLFSEDFSKGAFRWDVGSGKWEVKNGEYVQTTTDTFLNSFVKEAEWDLAWTEYTLELKAKKLGGAEGWDIVFGIAKGDKVPAIKDDRGTMTFYDWNIAGWANTRSVLRKRVKGAGSNVFETQVGKTVENDKWYHIRVEVSPDKIVGYLDDEQAFVVEEGPAEGRIGFSLFGTSAVFDDIVVYDEGGLAVEPAEKLAAAWGELKRLK